MLIRIPIRFEGSKGEKIVYALFDSGATYSCITEELATTLTQPEPLYNPIRLVTASADTIMNVEKTCRLDFYHDEIRLSDEFLVMQGMSEEVIIGATTMQKWRLKLDFEKDRVIVDPAVAKMVLLDLKVQ